MQQHPGLPAGPYTLTRRDDEIDLLEFWKTLVSNWKMATLVAVLVVIMAVAYAFISPKQYQASAVIGLPSHAELHKVDQGARYFELTPDQEYLRLFQALINHDLQRKFYVEEILGTSVSNLSLDTQKGLAEFQKRLSIVKNEKGRKVSHENIVVSYIDADSNQAYRVLSDFISFADQAALKALEKDYAAALDASIQQFEKEMALLVDAKKMNVNSEITRFQEAARLAEAMGIIDSEMAKSSAVKELEKDESTMHLLGVKYLETKIDLLKKRENISSYVPGVPELSVRLQGFEAVNLNKGNATLVNYQKSPEVPYQHIKPKRALIVMLGVILGVFLGCAVALVKGIISKPKDKEPVTKQAKRTENKQHEAISYLMNSDYTEKEKMGER